MPLDIALHSIVPFFQGQRGSGLCPVSVSRESSAQATRRNVRIAASLCV